LDTGGTASATGNVTGGNILTTGLISAGGSVSATGNVTGGNISTAGLITATGNITATANIAAGNISTANLVQGATVSATANVIGANIQGGTLSLSGNVITAINTTSQILSTGNITGGNLIASGAVSGNGRALTSLDATNIDTGTLAQARLANAAVTLGSTALTLGATVTTVAGLTSVTSTTFVGALTGAATSATTAGTVTTAAQPNITSVGTLSAVSVTGNITGGNLITAGAASLSSITKTGSNGVGNIGAAASAFNTVFAKATSAQYADLAEMYCADAEYSPGTVLSFGGTQEVTISTQAGDPRVAGVVSTNPAHLMNSTLDCDCAVALALTGRVPTLVTGQVHKGDMMVSAGNGHAQACATPAMGTVIGKALEDFDGNAGTIEIVVGRM
jgi:hypothetical protein